jgi:trehalose 6-phosphate synthase
MRDAEKRGFVPAAGGLVSALLGVFKATGAGLWVAWAGSGAPERDPASARADLPPAAPFFTQRWVNLSERDVSQSYYGFSNRGLWPLSHYFVGRCQFNADQWQSYRRVNDTFAGVVVEELRDDDVVWVQDFQIALVPALIRRARPQVTLGYFWHVPFPEPSVFGILPWRAQVLEGMLGSDVIGFHLESYAHNFLACVERFLGFSIDWVRKTIAVGAREVRVVAWPIGIDTAHFEALARDPEVVQRSARIRRQLNSDRIVLGVDRLDYTKGILERLRGFERFLEESPTFRRRITFVQIAVPSRERVDEYRRMRADIDETVGRITGRFTTEGWVPIRYLYRSIPPAELAAYYTAADVALITPLRDGMNLVAKEYVATRLADDGILILSEFAGAAEDMPEAVRVNPYNIDDVAEQLHRAITMSPADTRARMAKLRERVREHDVRWWLRGFLGEFRIGGRTSPTGAYMDKLAARP